jgi:hypothetical protein
MWLRKLCPALLFFCSLALFLYTLAPTVTFVDSGELIVAAKNLSVAHPPGFPLYLMVAHLATLLPFGNPAQRVHFASALSAAIAVVLIYLITIEAILSLQNRASKQSTGKIRSQNKQALPFDKFIFIPGLVSAGLAAFSRTLWSYATVAEVYTLNALLILLVFLLVLRWRNRVLSSGAPIASTPGNNRILYFAAFVFGLALGVHHVTVALTLPAVLWLAIKTGGTKLLRSRIAIIAVLLCLAGLAIYSYLPIAASHSPGMNWGDPDTPARFWTHITGRQYQVNFSYSSDQLQRQLYSFAKLMIREFGWPWIPAGLVLAGIGFYWLNKKDRVSLTSLALIIGFNLLFALGYEIAEDKDAYSLPVFLAIAIAAGFGAHAILAAVKTRQRPMAALVLLLMPVLALAANAGPNNRRNYYVAEDYVGNIFRTIEPNGLLLSADWQIVSPILYYQEIVRQRPDVICIDVMLLRRSWYCRFLMEKYPLLMNEAGDSVQAFMDYLIRWEEDPDVFERDSQLVQRLDARFCSMISTLVEKHLPSGPVYSTSDVVLNSGGENQTIAKTLLGSYQIVPQGLVFQLFADRGFHPTELPELRMRGLIDRAASIEEDQVVRQKVIPVYATMLVNCGRAFASRGNTDRAMAAYRQAWAIDSALLVERNLLPAGISFENKK